VPSFRLIGLAVAGLGTGALFVACGSVPDIQFVDDDASAARDGATSTSSSGADAADVANPAPDAATADQSSPPAYCASKNPPPGGICCGTIPCVGCEPGDCGDCDSRCRASGVACCKKSQVRCAAVADCNN
jgi:hypothetical protein